MDSLSKQLSIVIKGALVGIGNIIPGVSGGTVALILGIYPRILEAITKVRLQTLYIIWQFFWAPKKKLLDLRKELNNIDALFLMQLASGAFLGIIGLAFLLSYLLTNHREATYSFFFGLILMSIIFPYRLLRRKSYREFIAVIAGICFIIAITVVLDNRRKDVALQKALNPSMQTTATAASNLPFYFLAGAVAISAMILPGISGSLIMLLLGVYFEILHAIKGISQFLVDANFAAFLENMLLLTVFALGCFAGLLCFTRILNYILQRYYDPTMAFLTGLIIGSLYGIWPFARPVLLNDQPVLLRGKQVFVDRFIPDICPETWIAIITFGVGCALIGVFYHYERKTPVEPAP